jgi:hypothetical protein
MRRVVQGSRRASVVAALACFGATGVGAACREREVCLGSACSAACPRNSSPGADGRCVCEAADVLVLGACVPPTAADAYCGPAAKVRSSDGRCAFPVCRESEVVDVDTGCSGVGALWRGGRACAAGLPIVEGGRFACVPGDAACPPGTHAVSPSPSVSATGQRPPGADRPKPAGPTEGRERTQTPTSCEYALACPAGSLPAEGGCRPIVSRGARSATVVDVGAWAALVLGFDGGRGSSDLCRRLQAHPSALDLSPGESSTVAIRVVLSFPGQDISAAYSTTTIRANGADGAGGLPPAAADLAARATGALVELLRGLGGQASSSRVEVEVRCTIFSL